MLIKTLRIEKLVQENEQKKRQTSDFLAIQDSPPEIGVFWYLETCVTNAHFRVSRNTYKYIYFFGEKRKYLRKYTS